MADQRGLFWHAGCIFTDMDYEWIPIIAFIGLMLAGGCVLVVDAIVRLLRAK